MINSWLPVMAVITLITGTIVLLIIQTIRCIYLQADREKLKIGIGNIMRDYESRETKRLSEERFAAGLISAVEYIGRELGYPEWIRRICDEANKEVRDENNRNGF